VSGFPLFPPRPPPWLVPEWREAVGESGWGGSSANQDEGCFEGASSWCVVPVIKG
jgi:hypothetical protein